MRLTIHSCDAPVADERPAEFDYVLSENPQLNETLAQYELPIVTHSTIENDGYGACAPCLVAPRADARARRAKRARDAPAAHG